MNNKRRLESDDEEDTTTQFEDKENEAAASSRPPRSKRQCTSLNNVLKEATSVSNTATTTNTTTTNPILCPACCEKLRHVNAAVEQLDENGNVIDAEAEEVEVPVRMKGVDHALAVAVSSSPPEKLVIEAAAAPAASQLAPPCVGVGDDEDVQAGVQETLQALVDLIETTLTAVHDEPDESPTEVEVLSCSSLSRISSNSSSSSSCSSNCDTDDCIVIEQTPKATPPLVDLVAVDDNDEEVETKGIVQLKRLLALTSKTSLCSVACQSSLGGEAFELPTAHVQLNMAEFGAVRFPLHSRVEQHLLSFCEQFAAEEAPFVHTHELDARRLGIETLGAEWSEQLNRLAQRVARSMGCLGSVDTSLDKLLIFIKPGGVAPPAPKYSYRRSSGDGAVCHLFIELPHEGVGAGGGELVVRDPADRSTAIHDFGHLEEPTAASKERSLYFAAVHVDAEHHFTVASTAANCRVLLAYSLRLARKHGSLMSRTRLVERLADAVASLDTSSSSSRVALMLDTEHINFDDDEDDEVDEDDDDDDDDGKKIDDKMRSLLVNSDLERYVLLQAVNERLPSDKRLRFYLLTCDLEVRAREYRSRWYDQPSTRIRRVCDADGTIVFDEMAAAPAATANKSNQQQISSKSLTDVFRHVLCPTTTRAAAAAANGGDDALENKAAWGRSLHEAREEYVNSEADTSYDSPYYSHEYRARVKVQRETYRRHFLAMWPAGHDLDAQCDLCLSHVIETLYDELRQQDADNANAATSGVAFADRVLRVIDKFDACAHVRDKDVNKMLELLFDMDSVELSVRFLRKLKRFSLDQIAKGLGALVMLVGWTPLSDTVLELANLTSTLAHKCMFVDVSGDHVMLVFSTNSRVSIQIALRCCT